MLFLYLVSICVQMTSINEKFVLQIRILDSHMLFLEDHAHASQLEANVTPRFCTNEHGAKAKDDVPSSEVSRAPCPFFSLILFLHTFRSPWENCKNDSNMMSNVSGLAP